MVRDDLVHRYAGIGIEMRTIAWLAAASLLVGCAETTPSSPPPVEVLVVVNRNQGSLSVVPVHSVNGVSVVSFGSLNATGVSAREGIVVVPLGTDDAAAIVDLGTSQVRTVQLPAGSGAIGAAVVDDTIAYVANPNLNTVTRINYRTLDTASVAVGEFPQGMVFTRGKLFVVNGNRSGSTVLGDSWITVIDPVTNLAAEGVDSIALPGPGNARFADVASDGLLYLTSAGDASVEGRLSIVDPVGREEFANFGGFGFGPGNLAAGADGRLYISSLSEGVMEFNTDSRTVLRGAGEGVPIANNMAVETDSEGRVYAIDAGACSGGAAGTVHVLRVDLSEARSFAVGECAVAAVVTEIPPE